VAISYRKYNGIESSVIQCGFWLFNGQWRPYGEEMACGNILLVKLEVCKIWRLNVKYNNIAEMKYRSSMSKKKQYIQMSKRNESNENGIHLIYGNPDILIRREKRK